MNADLVKNCLRIPKIYMTFLSHIFRAGNFLKLTTVHWKTHIIARFGKFNKIFFIGKFFDFFLKKVNFSVMIPNKIVSQETLHKGLNLQMIRKTNV